MGQIEEDRIYRTSDGKEFPNDRAGAEAHQLALDRTEGLKKLFEDIDLHIEKTIIAKMVENYDKFTEHFTPVIMPVTEKPAPLPIEDEVKVKPGMSNDEIEAIVNRRKETINSPVPGGEVINSGDDVGLPMKDVSPVLG